jgi:hypothetical protein
VLMKCDVGKIRAGEVTSIWAPTERLAIFTTHDIHSNARPRGLKVRCVGP